mmetsp:Transcript_53101/g.151287  ORF Transcript_53101/g.151287 Transcript_53101/m.151287 type:complete len:581 (-) Transcript_53101:105-1847(-)
MRLAAQSGLGFWLVLGCCSRALAAEDASVLVQKELEVRRSSFGKQTLQPANEAADDQEVGDDFFLNFTAMDEEDKLEAKKVEARKTPMLRWLTAEAGSYTAEEQFANEHIQGDWQYNGVPGTFKISSNMHNELVYKAPYSKDYDAIGMLRPTGGGSFEARVRSGGAELGAVRFRSMTRHTVKFSVLYGNASQWSADFVAERVAPFPRKKIAYDPDPVVLRSKQIHNKLKSIKPDQANIDDPCAGPLQEFSPGCTKKSDVPGRSEPPAVLLNRTAAEFMSHLSKEAMSDLQDMGHALDLAMRAKMNATTPAAESKAVGKPGHIEEGPAGMSLQNNTSTIWLEGATKLFAKVKRTLKVLNSYDEDHPERMDDERRKSMLYSGCGGKQGLTLANYSTANHTPMGVQVWWPYELNQASLDYGWDVDHWRNFSVANAGSPFPEDGFVTGWEWFGGGTHKALRARTVLEDPIHFQVLRWTGGSLGMEFQLVAQSVANSTKLRVMNQLDLDRKDWIPVKKGEFFGFSFPERSGFGYSMAKNCEIQLRMTGESIALNKVGDKAVFDQAGFEGSPRAYHAHARYLQVPA